jgi:branched-chain amino acid transport system substrate-binding protein
MKKYIWIAVLVVVVIIASVYMGEGKKEGGSKIKVGVLLPLSGDFAWWGETAKNGIELAQKKGIANDFDFIYQDTKCNTKDAVSGTQSLKALNPSMHLFIVACDNDLKAMTPILDKNSDLAFVAGLSGPDLYESEFPIINLSYRLESEASTVSNFASKQLGLKKLGLILGNNTFGKVLGDSIPKDFANLGGSTVVEKIEINDLNVESAVLKIMQSKPDGIYIHNNNPSMAAVLKRLDQVGYRGPRIIVYSGRDQSLIDNAGKSAEGVYVPWVISDSKTDVQAKFATEYKNAFGKDPFVTSYFIYDGISLLDESNKKCNGDARCIENYFYGKSDFSGVLGNVLYKAGGQTERAFYFNQVKDGKFVEVR